jgi:hypothetical protein
VVDYALPRSEKGSRRLQRPARRRGGAHAHGWERVITVFGRRANRDETSDQPADRSRFGAPATTSTAAPHTSRWSRTGLIECASAGTNEDTISAAGQLAGSSFARQVGADFLTAGMLRTSLLPRLDRDCVLTGRSGAASALAVFCKSAGIVYERESAANIRSELGGWARSQFGAEGLVRRFRTWVLTFRGVATRYLDHDLRWFRHVDATVRDAPQRAAEALLTLALEGRKGASA